MQKKRQPEPDKELTFTGHLSELRKRLLVLFAAFIALFCIGLYKADAVISLFNSLGRSAGYRFVYIKYFGDIGKAAGIHAEVSLTKFLDFVLAMIIAIGISFDFPVVCFLLSAIGIVDSSMLKKARPFVIVAIFIVAAIITPPDVMTQLIPN